MRLDPQVGAKFFFLDRDLLKRDVRLKDAFGDFRNEKMYQRVERTLTCRFCKRVTTHKA